MKVVVRGGFDEKSSPVNEALRMASTVMEDRYLASNPPLHRSFVACS
jgi:hypothetical protein